MMEEYIEEILHCASEPEERSLVQALLYRIRTDDTLAVWSWKYEPGKYH